MKSYLRWDIQYNYPKGKNSCNPYNEILIKKDVIDGEAESNIRQYYQGNKVCKIANPAKPIR